MKKSLAYRVQEFLAENTKSVQYPRHPALKKIEVAEPSGVSGESAFILFFLGLIAIVVSLAVLMFIAVIVF